MNTSGALAGAVPVLFGGAALSFLLLVQPATNKNSGRKYFIIGVRCCVKFFPYHYGKAIQGFLASTNYNLYDHCCPLGLLNIQSRNWRRYLRPVLVQASFPNKHF